jgi:hypothetical protein
VYQIAGRVDVGCDGGFRAPASGSPYTSTTPGCTTPLTADTNVTLGVDPGVIFMAEPGATWLAVNRGNKINAVGTATQPIIFTSRENVVGTATDSSNGQWGGVVLLGRGFTTDCTAGGTATGDAATHTCERQTEGASDPARFGGVDNTYNAGRMSYVQIRYSGFVLGANSELQALTTQSIGTGTVLDHIQAHNSSDDGAEFFGGAVNMKYYVSTGADDDSLDVDTGAQMNLQWALLLQRPGFGDALMEIDSNGQETALPRTKLQVSNVVARQNQVSQSNNGANSQAALFFRGNSDTTLINGVVIAPDNECVRLNASGSTTARVTLTARSVVLQCGTPKYITSGTSGVTYSVDEIAAIFSGNNNNDAFTNSITNTFFNGANENSLTATNPTTFSSFFNALTPLRIGAAWTGNDTWYQGWTCNSDVANFGTASTACTSLPIS